MVAAARDGTSPLRPTWVEIDLGALERNFRRIHDLVGRRRVWCVVKADAYGHGAVAVARRLLTAGADALAVATVDEGLELREAGVEAPVLLLAGIGAAVAADPRASERVRLVAENRFSVAVWDAATIEALSAAGVEKGRPVGVHLKIDTGMGRLGVPLTGSRQAIEAAVALARIADAGEGIRFDGVFSNLAAADAPPGEPGHAHTTVQTERFVELCAALAAQGLLPPERHLANSSAIQQHPGAWRPDWCSGVRPGLALYGASRTAGHPDPMGTEPVMSWRSMVMAVREVPEGWPLGYGAVRRATSDCRIAVVPVGYHDGLPRALGDRADLLVAGKRAKVVGAISMDLTLVDITGIPDAGPGSPVVVIGAESAPGIGSIPVQAVRVEELAEQAGTIAHEFLCRVGRRVPRRFMDSRP